MPVTWKCELCGKEKITKPSAVGRFCGKECLAKFNSKRLDTNTYKECEICGNSFKTKPSHYNKRRTCSNKCSGQLKVKEGKDCGSWNKNHTLEKSHNWKGGRRVRKNGYVYLRVYRNKEIFEHRFVVEKELGKKLSPEEHVHHENENKQDNDPSNLTIMSRSRHQSYHAKKRIQDGTHHFLK